MKKVAFVLLGLSMAFLVGCQTKGECDSCGDNEKLYYKKIILNTFYITWHIGN